jgi:large subunit ribosomal protein L33
VIGICRGNAVAKKSKDARSYIKMQSSESSHCYYLQKNRNNTKDRLQLKKYDPVVRKHVMYKEGKM